MPSSTEDFDVNASANVKTSGADPLARGLALMALAALLGLLGWLVNTHREQRQQIARLEAQVTRLQEQLERRSAATAALDGMLRTLPGLLGNRMGAQERAWLDALLGHQPGEPDRPPVPAPDPELLPEMPPAPE